MLDVFNALGIEKNDAFLAKIAEQVLKETRMVVPGYRYDYLLYTFPGYIDCYLYKSIKDNSQDIVLHFSGIQKVGLTFDRVISDDPLNTVFQMHHDIEENAFPVRIVCPDILAKPMRGDYIKGQMVAFSSGKIEMREYNQKSELSISDAGECNVFLSGRIKDVDEFRFDFEGVNSEYWELIVETSLGDVSVIVLKDDLFSPKKNMLISTEAVLSLDISACCYRLEYNQCYASHNYDFYGDEEFGYGENVQGGFEPTRANANRLFLEAIEKNSFDRIERACVRLVEVIEETGEKSVICREEISAMLGDKLNLPGSTCELKCVQESSEKILLGQEIFEIKTRDGQYQYIMFLFDSHGFISKIRFINTSDIKTTYDAELRAVGVFADAVFRCDNPYDLRGYLSKDCHYYSEYSQKCFFGSDCIISGMASVAKKIDETSKYTADIVELKSILKREKEYPELYRGNWCIIARQFGEIAGVIALNIGTDGLINQIVISRSQRYFDFFDEDMNNKNQGNKPAEAEIRELDKDAQIIYVSPQMTPGKEEYEPKYLSIHPGEILGCDFAENVKYMLGYATREQYEERVVPIEQAMEQYNRIVKRLWETPGFKQSFAKHNSHMTYGEIEEEFGCDLANVAKFLPEPYYCYPELISTADALQLRTFRYVAELKLNDTRVEIPLNWDLADYPKEIDGKMCIWNLAINGSDYGFHLATELAKRSKIIKNINALYAYENYDQWRGHSNNVIDLMKCIFKNIYEFGYLKKYRILADTMKEVFANATDTEDASIGLYLCDYKMFKDKLLMARINALLEACDYDEEEPSNRGILVDENGSLAFGSKFYYLQDEHNKTFISRKPGTFGGHYSLKIYGKTDCPSANMYVKKGQYVKHRVFFENEEIAKKAGYRPCAKCMPEAYRLWKARNK